MSPTAPLTLIIKYLADVALAHNGYSLFPVSVAWNPWFWRLSCLFVHLERWGSMAKQGDIRFVGFRLPIFHTAVPSEVWPPPKAESGSIVWVIIISRTQRSLSPSHSCGILSYSLGFII